MAKKKLTERDRLIGCLDMVRLNLVKQIAAIDKLIDYLGR